jgi:hypothetical protein
MALSTDPTRVGNNTYKLQFFQLQSINYFDMLLPMILNLKLTLIVDRELPCAYWETAGRSPFSQWNGCVWAQQSVQVEQIRSSEDARAAGVLTGILLLALYLERETLFVLLFLESYDIIFSYDKKEFCCILKCILNSIQIESTTYLALSVLYCYHTCSNFYIRCPLEMERI